HQTNYVRLFEHTLHAFAIEIGKGGLIKKFRVHNATRRQMIDDEIKKFELICRQPATIQKFSVGTLGRLAVEPHKTADETRQSAVGLERDETYFINPGLNKDTLKLVQVGGGQWLVSLHLKHGDVVLMRLKKHARLTPEGLYIGADRNARHVDVR